MGAANTLRRGIGGWDATNTDVAGFLAPLESLLAGGASGDRVPAMLSATRAAVLGAGGAARAVVTALRSRGVAVTVHARRQKQAQDLAALARLVAGLPRLQLRGLMAIPEPTDDAALQHSRFALLRQLKDDLVAQGLVLDTLSMGMSADLEAAVASGRFRKDLFYRLHVIAITLPPLRTRGEDIPGLAMHFLRRFASQNGKLIRP